MSALFADCRHAIRLYLKTPGASLIAILVLGIGVAFVVAFLSLYVDLILRPHPGFNDAERLATVARTGGPELVGVPFTITERMADELASVEAVAASRPTSVLIGTEREQGGIELVSGQFFDGLRPRLALGSGFSAEHHRPDAEAVAVISYRLWQSRYGGRRDVLGELLELTRDPASTYTEMEAFEFNGQSAFLVRPGAPEQATTRFRIVGVMSESLRGLTRSETAVWVPLEHSYSLFVGSDRMLYSLESPRSIVRRREGVDALAVRSEIEARFGDDPLLASTNYRLDTIDGVVRDMEVQRDANRQLRMFLIGSVMLALVAAANVSLFLLARAPGRRRELGIRLAVGAPPGRLARQLASEATLLVAAGAAVGLVLSVWLSAFLRDLALLRDAEWREVTLLDWRVLSLTAVFLITLSLLVSLAPVVGLKRAGIAASSRTTTSRASLAQRLAGTAQIAIAGTLGAAAIAFGWHLAALSFGDPGYTLEDRYLARFELPEPGIFGSNNSPIAATRLRDTVAAIPGVSAVAIGSTVPGEEQSNYIAQVPDPADSTAQIEARWTIIDSHYIDVVGLRLLHGRAPEDAEGGVVLVNQAVARTWWGRDDVVGEVLPFPVVYTDPSPRIVGVLEDLSYSHPSATALPRVFTTWSNLNTNNSALVIETTMTAAALQQELIRLAASGDLELDVREVQPLNRLRNDAIAPDRARGLLTIVTALLVVFLSAFGFYGTQRYLVAAGRREYAIRSSLGAGPRSLGRLVIARGLVLGLPGLVAGGLLGYIAVAWLRDGFVASNVSPGLVAGGVAGALIALLAAASSAPAGEARRTQPAALLRED